MDTPCIRRLRRKNVLLLIFCIACIVSAGFPGRLNADTGTKKLKRAIGHFQQASSLYGDKKLDEAIAEYRQALRDDPQEPYWHQALGKALEDKGDLQGALKENRTASQQSPLDIGLRSKCEELQQKLEANVESKPARTTTNGPETFKKGKNATAPLRTYGSEPTYSEKARKAKYQGTAVLSIVVDAEGNVSGAQVVKPLGLGLDEQALETVGTWKFKPATRDGVPIPVRVYVEVSFRLF
jgi:TonB family protein